MMDVKWSIAPAHHADISGAPKVGRRYSIT